MGTEGPDDGNPKNPMDEGASELLLEMAREGLTLEYDRADSVEAKAGQFLTLIGLISAIGTFGLVDMLGALKRLATCLDVVMLVSLGIGLVLIGLAIFHFVRVLAVLHFPAPPVNQEWVDYFGKANRATIVRHLSIKLATAVMDARKLVTWKYEKLKLAKRLLLFSFFAFVVTYLCFAILKYREIK